MDASAGPGHLSGSHGKCTGVTALGILKLHPTSQREPGRQALTCVVIKSIGQVEVALPCGEHTGCQSRREGWPGSLLPSPEATDPPWGRGQPHPKLSKVP